MSRSIPSPAFASSEASSGCLIVPPFDPPEPSVLSYVPDACQASLTAIGQAFAFLLIKQLLISEHTA
eukprot:CAMPEP_0204831156 /NCGR_PEP_ID=MMETSP1346-20131115/10015_1 /ASSEMBLY_ACC=CAM_ASM_000771 /TAXON_ID=215587 /ORGANISM="Aplanochytrium stocchinoi, Strain GSBS06" /LENGTH=66 /DNA_ID=CAMNT_0051961965 /DNA_START=312 /DNA_END=509 /DNA_ORIENTATION=-